MRKLVSKAFKNSIVSSRSKYLPSEQGHHQHLHNINNSQQHRCYHHNCNCCQQFSYTKVIKKITPAATNNNTTATSTSTQSKPTTTSNAKIQQVMTNASSTIAPNRNIKQQQEEEFEEEYDDTLEETPEDRNNPLQNHSNAFNTFVSNFYKINESDIQEFLTRKGLGFRNVMNEIIVKECPFCHDTKGKVTNLWKLYIHRASGAYMCHRCGAKGSWFDFKMNFHKDSPISTLHSDSVSNNQPKAGGQNNETSATNLPKKRDKPTKKEFETYRSNFDGVDFPEAVQYLEKVRGIKKDVAAMYGVGCGVFPFSKVIENPEQETENLVRVNELCFTFPMFKPTKSHESGILLSRHKIRAIQDKTCMKLDPPQTNNWGLFGWHLIASKFKNEKPSTTTTTTNPQSNDLKTIIITEGEFDAMAVYQKTGIPAVSLPNGCRSLPVDVVQWLEDFDKIYLWMDDDVPGQQGAELFSKKLGVGRCYIVHSNYKEVVDEYGDPIEQTNEKKIKDANEALLAGLDFHRLIEEAAPIQHERILTFNTFKQQVYRELFDKSEVVNGVQSHFFPGLNKILKGHRRGELTIITGATGIGKTTVLSQLSLDYCKYGNVPTLWGSFEIRNHRLIKKMMCQLAARQYSPEELKRDFEIISEQFSELPMYFLNFYGSTDIDELLDAMDYAVYVYDVAHIVIDNLQFMMSTSDASYTNRFELQDKAIEKLRKFATTRSVHVTLVVHPKKIDEKEQLQISSVFGSAKATQEADNIIMIQRNKHYKYLQVKKNRFDGTLGIVPYRFERNRGERISELTEKEIELVEKGQLTIDYE
ncbi:predicted protein [Naegleria gruberi]|uniref:Predicted protein n=1 Tax=Naegleria gruberi TaxID=5762 RepID=D2V6S5_NAEGR|nr:uncharacterized protein NAEGRDRAFT_31486 [Naegleria gruberi]EFC47626.1 predicted protein [Naegleria gruberi]|eukprot:XP_002680370.1 predicted protein [Naegleria gruberi strain NEG-M]